LSTGWVIDSSVGFAWAHPDQATTATEQLLDEVANGVLVVVPVLWFVEMANGLLVLQRCKRITSAERRVALQILSDLPLVIDEESGRTAFQKTSGLAEKHGRTVYDATYLEVAVRRKLSFATRDSALQTAAKRCGLPTLRQS
jgi:predicted nucleic acid-binding protein